MTAVVTNTMANTDITFEFISGNTTTLSFDSAIRGVKDTDGSRPINAKVPIEALKFNTKTEEREFKRVLISKILPAMHKGFRFRYNEACPNPVLEIRQIK